MVAKSLRPTRAGVLPHGKNWDKIEGIRRKNQCTSAEPQAVRGLSSGDRLCAGLSHRPGQLHTNCKAEPHPSGNVPWRGEASWMTCTDLDRPIRFVGSFTKLWPAGLFPVEDTSDGVLELSSLYQTGKECCAPQLAGHLGQSIICMRRMRV